jgi:hypothetical protein
MAWADGRDESVSSGWTAWPAAVNPLFLTRVWKESYSLIMSTLILPQGSQQLRELLPTNATIKTAWERVSSSQTAEEIFAMRACSSRALQLPYNWQRSHPPSDITYAQPSLSTAILPVKLSLTSRISLSLNHFLSWKLTHFSRRWFLWLTLWMSVRTRTILE